MQLVDIGNRIRETRKQLGISQQALAVRAGVSRYTLIKLENGKADDVQFQILAAILGELNLAVSIKTKPVSGVAVLGEGE